MNEETKQVHRTLKYYFPRHELPPEATEGYQLDGYEWIRSRYRLAIDECLMQEVLFLKSITREEVVIACMEKAGCNFHKQSFRTMVNKYGKGLSYMKDLAKEVTVCESKT